MPINCPTATLSWLCKCSIDNVDNLWLPYHMSLPCVGSYTSVTAYNLSLSWFVHEMSGYLLQCLESGHPTYRVSEWHQWTSNIVETFPVRFSSRPSLASRRSGFLKFWCTISTPKIRHSCVFWDHVKDNRAGIVLTDVKMVSSIDNNPNRVKYWKLSVWVYAIFPPSWRL